QTLDSRLRHVGNLPNYFDVGYRPVFSKGRSQQDLSHDFVRFGFRSDYRSGPMHPNDAGVIRILINPVKGDWTNHILASGGQAHSAPASRTTSVFTWSGAWPSAGARSRTVRASQSP